MRAFKICIAISMSLCVLVGCGPQNRSTDNVSKVSEQSYGMNNSTWKSIEGDGILIVHGKTIARNIRFSNEYERVELPIVAILMALGAKVEWTSETTATIRIDSREFRLDTTACSLTDPTESVEFNYLKGPVYGVTSSSTYERFCQAVDCDVIVDESSLFVLLVMELNQRIMINSDAKTVKIEDQLPPDSSC